MSSLNIEAMSPEEMAKLTYAGPMYIDLDMDKSDPNALQVVLEQFHKLLANLSDLRVDLKQLQLFATGGRGFHVLIPQQLFAEKVSRTGTLMLPAIWKEVAFALFVDTLDMRVYTARKGRMFRVENSQRVDGAYKVPPTTDEALSLTVDLYEEFCRAPRRLPKIMPPVLNQKLAVLHAKAQQKVDAAQLKSMESCFAYRFDRKLLSPRRRGKLTAVRSNVIFFPRDTCCHGSKRLGVDQSGGHPPDGVGRFHHSPGID